MDASAAWRILGPNLVLACLKFDKNGLRSEQLEGPFSVGAYLLALDLQYHSTEQVRLVRVQGLGVLTRLKWRIVVLEAR